MKKRRPFPWWCRILLAVALVVVVGTVWLLLRPDISPKDVRHIILISIDTCRADYLSCYGYPRKTTPNIDAIAEESILFENVISPVPLTLPAHASMLTGTIPPYHGVHDNHDYWLGDSNVTLAEILTANGFTTAAFISAFVMDSQFGLDQGFNTYNDHLEQKNDHIKLNERRGEKTTRLALEWLDQHKKEKFFLFLHYYDPHSDYEPPEPFASRFADNLYAGEIAYTDYCIAQVIEKLKDLQLFDSALIIITSDHGEMLQEHGEEEHGYFVYQSAIKVPLIFRLPGLHKSKKITNVVGLIDIMPTICRLLGIKPPPNVQGIDLSPYFFNKSCPAEERYIYCESLQPTKYGCNSLLGVVTDAWKYIQTTRPELYNLAEDPTEANNLIKQQPQWARILQDHLRQILEQTVGKRESGSPRRFASQNRSTGGVLDEETRKRLESLGYVAGAVSEDFEFDQSKNDPKDLIDFHLSSTKAHRLISQKKFAEAKSLCKKLSLQQPGFYEIYRNLGKIAFEEGDREKAKAYMLKSLKLNPDQADLHNNLGMVLAEQDKHSEAISHLTQSLRLNPKQMGVYFALANMFEKLRKFDQAINHYTKVLEIDPEMAAAHNNLGSILLRQGKLKRAIVHCTKALEINPELPEAHYNLGNIRFNDGDFEEAIMHYKKALSLRPNWREARMNLSIAESRKEMP